MKNGKITENVYRRSILQQLKYRRKEVLVGAGPGEDCAIFSFSGRGDTGEGTGCFVTQETCFGKEMPVEFEVVRTLQHGWNLLAERGARAVAVSLRILLPATAQEDLLKKIVSVAETCCGEHGVQIAQAGGSVTEAVATPVLTVTALGRYEPQPDFHTVHAARPGHDMVVSGYIGMEGSAILAERYGDLLASRYPAWIMDNAKAFAAHISTEQAAAAAIKSGVCAMRNVTEGGILAALWELAEGAGVGLTIELKKLPIRQETVEICNHLNRNPYELMSGGCLLMTTEDGTGLVDALQEEGIPAVIVGKITDSRDRLILNDDEVRFLDRPHPDSLYDGSETE